MADRAKYTLNKCKISKTKGDCYHNESKDYANIRLYERFQSIWKINTVKAYIVSYQLYTSTQFMNDSMCAFDPRYIGLCENMLINDRVFTISLLEIKIFYTQVTRQNNQQRTLKNNIECIEINAEERRFLDCLRPVI